MQQQKQVKKTVAIIGTTEKSGAAIANKFAVGNHRLLLIANEINQLSQIARNIKRNNLNAEVEMVDCAKEGAAKDMASIKRLNFIIQATLEVTEK